MTSCGKWVSLGEYAERAGLSESEARRIFDSAGSLTKRVAGVDYIWADDPDSLASKDAEEREETAGKGESLSGSVNQDSLASRSSSFEDMALQTERAISVVERSLNAFMMMHQEVVREKERAAERAGEGVPELEEELARHKEALRRLESSLQEKDQEIADLKMLVDILESRGGGSAFEVDEGASVGDVMEDQLKYITEQQMIKDLLEE
ncbi:MAG: hypothetical protein R6V10_10690 [bacterium]